MADKMDIVVSLKDRMSSGMKHLNKSLLVTKGGVNRLKNAVFGLKAAVISVAAVFAGKQLIDIANEQAKSVKGMETALRSMGRYTPEFAKNMQDIASNIQSFTNYGDEAVIMGQKFLATYVNITDDLLPRVSLAMVDLAALMGGDMQRASNMMGKASMGMVGQLSLAGISIEKGVYQAEGFVGVLKRIENQSRGQARAQREATGSIIAMGNSFDDVKEKAGDFLKIILEPSFQVVLDRFDSLNEKIIKLKEEGKLVEWANDLSTKVVESLKFMVFGIVSVFETIGPIMSNFKMMFTTIWDWFTELPTWVQTSGLVLAIMGGPKVKASLVALAALSKGVSKVKDEIRLMTFEFRDSAPEIENYTLKLEALNILKEKFSKTPLFGEDEVEFETRRKKLKEIEEQIDIVEQKIRGLTPHKLIDDDSLIEDMGTVREVMTKFFDDLEEKRLALVAKLGEPKPEVGVPKGVKPAPERDIATLIQGEILELEVLYRQGEEQLISYLKRRRNLVLESLRIEMEKMEDAARKETDVTKQLQAEDQIFIKKQEYALKEIELTKAITQANEEAFNRKIEVEGMLADLSLRAQEGMDVIHAEELAEMDERHRVELEDFQKLLDDRLAAEVGYINEADALRDVDHKQQLEKEKLLADQKKEINKKRLAYASDIAGGLKDIANNLYEMSGKSNEKLFKITKAAAIASATVEGAKAITKSLAEGGPVMGPIMAAITAALVGIQITKISMTEMGGSFAEGGLIPGSSPHSKADNVQINATAGEYMQPVSSVKYYGKQVMDGMKNLSFPKEMFSGFALPTPVFAQVSSRMNYAEGGSVSQMKVSPTGSNNYDDSKGAITIVNVTDPRDIDQYLASSEGQDAVLNVLSSKSEEVKRVLR